MDEWIVADEGDAVDEAFLALIAETIEENDDIVLEHRHYRGASAPSRFVFSSGRRFRTYMSENARPGDRFVVWRFSETCSDDRIWRMVKFPDASNRILKGGAY